MSVYTNLHRLEKKASPLQHNNDKMELLLSESKLWILRTLRHLQ